MPRLKRKKREKKADFERSLARFLTGPRKMWFYGPQFMAIKTSEHQAGLKDKHTGKSITVMLRRVANERPELLLGQRVITVEQFLEGLEGTASAMD